MANYEQVGTITLSPTLMSDKKQEYPVYDRLSAEEMIDKNNETFKKEIGPFVINAKKTGTAYTMDTTYAEIKAAYENGRRIVLHISSSYNELTEYISGSGFKFTTLIVKNSECEVSEFYISYAGTVSNTVKRFTISN